MCFECGCLGHKKEQCPHIVRHGPSSSKVGSKEASETCFSSHVDHVPDEIRSGEGTSGVLLDSEQSTEQTDMREGVYRPWIVIACRKTGTNSLRSGGTLHCQSNGIGIRNSKFMDKGSMDRATVLDGVRRKLAPQKFLDKAQISSVVQSFRQGSKDQAQSNPTLKLESSVTRPKLAQNTLRLSSVKRKKGAARSRNINGDQRSADQGVLSSSHIGLKQSQMDFD